MSDYKIGDMVWVRGKITDVDAADDNHPVEVDNYDWPAVQHIRRDDPRPPVPPAGKFRVRDRNDRTWLMAVDGLNSSPSRIVARWTSLRSKAFIFPPHWHWVFAAEDDRFEIVLVDLYERPWKWDAGEKAIRSASGEFVASFGDETEHLGPLIVERVNKAEV